MAGEWDRKPSRDRVRLLLKHYIEDLVVGGRGELCVVGRAKLQAEYT